MEPELDVQPVGQSRRTADRPGTTDRRGPSRRRRSLAPSPTVSGRLAVAGVILYAAVDTALVFLRPELSILHNAESDYGSSGPWAWLMDLNFLLRCLLSLAAVHAITLTLGGSDRHARMRLAVALLLVWTVGSGLLAFFPDDPAGTPTHWAGQVHLALAFIAFVAILVGAILVSRELRSHPRWRPVAMPMTILSRGAVIPLLLLGHAHFSPHSLGGLYEKIFLAIELLWLLATVAPMAADLPIADR